VTEDPRAAKLRITQERALFWGQVFARAEGTVERGLNLYGRFNETQRSTVTPHVRGQHIHDLGAGDGSLAIELLGMGAEKVTAIDRHKIAAKHCNLVTWEAYFHDLPPSVKPSVVFLSWPPNHTDYALLQLCQGASVLIYLGKCTDGTACGFPELFDDMIHRELLAYVPDRLNTLIIVGDRQPHRRKPQGEERAGLEMNTGPMLRYDHAEGQEVQEEVYLVATNRGPAQKGRSRR